MLETLAELCDDHARKARDNSRASGAIEFVRFRLWRYAIHRSRCQAGRLVVGHTRRGHGCGSHGLLSSSGDTAREPCRLALCSQALNIDALEDPDAALGSLGWQFAASFHQSNRRRCDVENFGCLSGEAM